MHRGGCEGEKNGVECMSEQKVFTTVWSVAGVWLSRSTTGGGAAFSSHNVCSNIRLEYIKVHKKWMGIK